MKKAGRRYFPITEQLAIVLLFWLVLLPGYHSIFFRVMAVVSCILCATLMLKKRAPILEDWLVLPPLEASFAKWTASFWFVAAGATLVTLLLSFEHFHPLYFTQMDNHSQFLPVIIPAMRAFFEQGIFPTWNGYQFLGVPTASLGYYALTYPPLYLCYAVARYLCGNEFLTLELFTWGHLLIGYAVTFVLLRHLSVRPSLAAAGAFCFVLMGYNILFGLIWYYVSPTVVYLPLLCLSVVSCMRSPPNLRWVIFTALIIGCYFHSGNVQMWSYGLLFWGVCILWICLCHRMHWREYTLLPVAALLVGLALAMPLLVPLTLQTLHASRESWDVNISPLATSLLIPWLQESSTTSDSAQDFVENNPVMVFTGGIFAFAFLIRFCIDVAYLSKIRQMSPKIITTCFSLLALIGITLGMGSHAILWDVLGLIPPFSKFRMPVKISPFMGLFIIMSGASFLEALLRRYRWMKLAGSIMGLLAVTMTILAYQNVHFFVPYVEKTYPEILPSEKKFQVEGFTTKGRVYPISPHQPDTYGFLSTFALNYPSILHIPVTGGFYLANPLETALPENSKANDMILNDPYRYMHAYATDWVAISALPFNTTTQHSIKEAYVKEYATARFMTRDLRQRNFPETKYYSMNVFNVHTNETKPMAYIDASSPSPLPYMLRTDGIDVKLEKLPEGVESHVLVANFLYRPWMKAWTDSGKTLSPYGDEYNRINVAVPESTTMISFRYCPPWRYGFYATILMLFFAISILRKVMPEKFNWQ